MRHDLQGVVEYCDRLDSCTFESFDPLIWEALSAAAVVRYARVFSPGSRDQLHHKLLESAASDLKEAHERFIAIRSKHFAHSVNGFEENDVTVTIRADGAALSLGGIGAAHGRTMGLSFGEPAILRDLANWVEQHIASEIAAEEAKLLPIARQMGAEAIHRLPVPGLGNTAFDDPRRARPRP